MMAPDALASLEAARALAQLDSIKTAALPRFSPGVSFQHVPWPAFAAFCAGGSERGEVSFVGEKNARLFKDTSFRDAIFVVGLLLCRFLGSLSTRAFSLASPLVCVSLKSRASQPCCARSHCSLSLSRVLCVVPSRKQVGVCGLVEDDFVAEAAAARAVADARSRVQRRPSQPSLKIPTRVPRRMSQAWSKDANVPRRATPQSHGQLGGMLAGRLGQNRYVVEYAADGRCVSPPPVSQHSHTSRTFPEIHIKDALRDTHHSGEDTRLAGPSAGTPSARCTFSSTRCGSGRSRPRSRRATRSARSGTTPNVSSKRSRACRRTPRPSRVRPTWPAWRR